MTSDRKKQGLDFNVEIEEDAEELDAQKQTEIRKALAVQYSRALSTPDGANMLEDMTAIFCGTTRSNNPHDLLLAEGARRAVEYMRNKKNQGIHFNSLSGGA